MKILHITPHMGGGVGDTIVGYLSVSKNENTVVSLGWTDDRRYDQIDVEYYDNMFSDHEMILDLIRQHDIVLIHWWNHPLLYDFLVRNELPPCRLIIWSHNSGLYEPNVYTKKIVDYPDVIVFTSPLSYNTKNVLESVTKKYNIWSTGGIDEFLLIEKIKRQKFTVGYVGTIDYAKMHPDFIEFCDIDDVEFIVVGHPDLLSEHVDKFTLPGYVNDLKEWYAKFDVFGYPLNPNHYGTCDLVLQMAMASGVVPVVLANPMELTIVEHMKTGLIAKNKDEYINYINMMKINPYLREQLSYNAREEARKRFSLNKLDSEWTRVFNDVMEFPKTYKLWDIIGTITPLDVFLESQGEYGEIFINDNEEGIKELGKKSTWKSLTKGTVHNYLSYYDDKTLKRWSELMNECDSDD